MGLLASGCAILRAPDMEKENGIASLRRPERPLIVIHGFLGAKLRHHGSGRVAWGTMGNILTGGDSDALALPLGRSATAAAEPDDLEPYELYDSLWGVDFYAKILRTLRLAGGYQVGDIDHPGPGDNAFVFVYDWRRDLVESAGRLGESIERLRRDLGDPDLRFDLLAHSQGGLIARYYVKYGARDVLDGEGTPRPTMAGAGSVGKVIMLGTPNRGSLEAFRALHVGVGKLFTLMRPEVVFTMPAVYQMLPPRGSDLFADVEGRTVDLDAYDPDTWVRQGWSAFSPGAQKRIRKRLARGPTIDQRMAERNRVLSDHLAWQLRRAERLHAALNAPAGPEAGVFEGTYYAFGSDCVSTLKTAIILNARSGEMERELVFEGTRLSGVASVARAERILNGPGDGTVLMRSLLAIPDGSEQGGASAGCPRFSSAFFVCDSHGVLPANPIFQNNLLYVLLWSADEPSSEGSIATTWN